MYQILLVEDDREICDILSHYLDRANYATIVAHDAREALSVAASRQIDLILLDIMLPGTDGIDLCVQLRRTLYCPIIFISCLDDEETIVRALRMGGDDYLTKPFRCAVLLAHIEAALRRMQLGSSRILNDIRFGDLLLSPKDRTLTRNGTQIYLSPTEFELLLYFINNQGTVLLFEEIYQYIWKKPSYGDLRTVFSHVRNLRKKIEANPSEPVLIRTIPRVGYQFDAPKPEQ